MQSLMSVESAWRVVDLTKCQKSEALMAGGAGAQQ